MHAEYRVDREVLEQPVVEHHLGTACRLLGRLKNEMNRAAELAVLSEMPCRAEQHRRVSVVAAGVHHAFRLRAMRELIRFVQRQRVHVCAQADARAGAVCERPDDSSSRQPFVHLQTKRAQPVGDECRCAVLVKRQLRMRVQIPAPSDELVTTGFDLRNGSQACALAAAILLE